MRRIDWRLSTLQILSMLLAIILTLSIVTFYHHQTEDYFIPLPEYLNSVKLAAPPLLVLISSYLLTFLFGEKVSDTPKLVIKYIKNSFLQNQKGMILFIATTSIASLTSWYYTTTATPPYYEYLVAKLLGGEQDRQQLITKEIKEIADKNSSFSKELQLVVDVFDLRSKWNFANKQANTTEPRILVRALDSNNISENWREHPLRKHALAEAYSMWAQASKNSSYSIESGDWNSLQQKAIEIYDEIIRSKSPLATPLMKSSAMNNAGNAYLYINDLTSTVKYYDRALSKNKNLSTAGNLIAVLVMQGKYEEAIKKGNEFMEWGKTTGKALTEGSSYSSVVGNTAFAQLIKGDYLQGSKLMLEAYDLESDDLNALNFIVSLHLSGKTSQALDLMARHFKYAALDTKDQAKRASEQYNPCYYLVSAALNSNASIALRAANLYMYLGIAKTLNQLESETPASLEQLLKNVEVEAERDSGACKDLLTIPRFKVMLHGV